MSDFKDENLSKELHEIEEKEEERLVQFLAERHGLPYLNQFELSVDLSGLQLIKKQRALEGKVAIFEKTRNRISLAIRDIKNKEAELIEKELTSRGYEIKKFIASTKTLGKIWNFYDDIKTSTKTSAGMIDLSEKEVGDYYKTDISSVKEFQTLINKTSELNAAHVISNSIALIISAAISIGSSDIHLESTEDGMIIRFRIDGILNQLHKFNISDGNKIRTRIKLVSGMKISISTIAQDGRFTVRTEGVDIECRVSSIPNPYGESVVLRLLDPRSIVVGLDNLGIHPSLRDVFNEQIKKPNGMIIVTGPTGSGKTTTLYAFLREILTPEIKIITLENPIEYHINGIVQTPISKNYSFSDGLRAILRQDPDVILVGEIRDPEVAEVAVNAALTGHLVFSTLHTNDAAGALPRLLELGVNAKTLVNALNLVIAQRLIRKTCSEAEFSEDVQAKTKEAVNKVLQNMPEKIKDEALSLGLQKIGTIKNIEDLPSKCHNGYKGRTGIYEALTITDNVINILDAGGGTIALREEIKNQGFMSIAENGVLKVLKGETTLSEVSRVTGKVF